jgi:2,4'-dihydroxyacetophenone dioxygenase
LSPYDPFMSNHHPALSSTEHLPWSPVSPGFDLKVLRGRSDDESRALLLRLTPGTVIGRHRHEGEVHALNLSGQRKLIETGEIIGPGGYVYEPPGNVDSWMAVGDEPLVVFVTVRGAIEYLDDDGNVVHRSSTRTTAESYFRHVDAVRAANSR